MATHERIRRYRRVALWIGIILATIWGLSWGLGKEQWGPFRGQIVDVGTGKPIKGAAVLVVWWKDVPTPVHAVQRFYDAREEVTDAEGRFEVPGRFPALFWLFIRKPQVIYLAPGYMAHAKVVTPPDGRPFVDATIVQMRRLKTREERRNNVLGRLPGGIPHEKMPKFIKVLNEELSALGLDTYSVRNK